VHLDQRVSGNIGFYRCNFLLVINCTRYRILHRFLYIGLASLRHVQRRYTWLSLLRFTQTEGFAWDDLRKILHGGQWMGKLQNGVEILLKLLTSWVGCSARTTDDRQRDRRQTDGFSTANTRTERTHVQVKMKWRTKKHCILWRKTTQMFRSDASGSCSHSMLHCYYWLRLRRSTSHDVMCSRYAHTLLSAYTVLPRSRSWRTAF